MNQVLDGVLEHYENEQLEDDIDTFVSYLLERTDFLKDLIEELIPHIKIMPEELEDLL